MAKRSILTRPQSLAIQAILTVEFGPRIRVCDPEFVGFATVSSWAHDRQHELFTRHPLFQTDAVRQDLRCYKRVRTSSPIAPCMTNPLSDGQWQVPQLLSQDAHEEPDYWTSA